MDFSFTAANVPYAFSSHPQPFPRYFADDRFEQGGRARGTARLDGEEISFEGFCHRDHSWGARVWPAVSHYKWINFLADDLSVHVMELQGYGRSDVRGLRTSSRAPFETATSSRRTPSESFVTSCASSTETRRGRSPPSRSVRRR